MRFLNKQQILSAIYHYGFLYPTPSNLTYFWNFGSLAGLALGIQILTGIALTFWYIGSVDLAFASVEFIMREVNYGWLIRYLHANGASLFFVVVYLHMGRGLFFGSYSYPREKLWMSGVIIFLVMIITAFLGYVLPWGQMSYWAATVITSLLSVIPFIGIPLLFYVWGGISIDQPTLSRVYGLHYLLPFVLFGLVVLHIVLLHEHGSNNSLGMEKLDLITFHPYFTYKDLLGVLVSLICFLGITVQFPNLLSHSDNYILADPGVTPTHIVPEWYFLPYYAILRSVPNKAGGVCLLLGAIFCLLFLPLFVSPLQRSGDFRPLFLHSFGVFVFIWFLLGWSGGNPIETPYYELCQLVTVFYFSFFLIFLPVLDFLENLFYQGFAYSDFLNRFQAQEIFVYKDNGKTLDIYHRKNILNSWLRFVKVVVKGHDLEVVPVYKQDVFVLSYFPLGLNAKKYKCVELYDFYHSYYFSVRNRFLAMCMYHNISMDYFFFLTQQFYGLRIYAYYLDEEGFRKHPEFVKFVSIVVSRLLFDSKLKDYLNLFKDTPVKFVCPVPISNIFELKRYHDILDQSPSLWKK